MATEQALQMGRRGKKTVTVCTKGYNSLTHAEVNHAPGSYVYSMEILYGANFNMADRTAGQLKSALRVSIDKRGGEGLETPCIYVCTPAVIGVFLYDNLYLCFY